jgi:hypothetical protein
LAERRDELTDTLGQNRRLASGKLEPADTERVAFVPYAAAFDKPPRRSLAVRG